MKIAIVGAGGVGAGFAAYLGERGHEIVALARGAHLAAIRERGLIVRRAGRQHVLPIAASDRAGELGPADLVLFAVKLWSTQDAGREARALIGPRTEILVLQNGVDAIDLLAPILGTDRLLGGVAQISAVIDEPGVVVQHSPFARIVAGEPSGTAPERADTVVAVLADAGIEARATDRIAVELWQKFVFIVGLSGATCFFRSSIGPILAHEETAQFLGRLVSEAIAVGRAEGIQLPGDQLERTLDFTRSLPGSMRASMYEDLVGGRRLELPWMAGRVIGGGQRHGIATPANSAVALALQLHAGGAPTGPGRADAS